MVKTKSGLRDVMAEWVNKYEWDIWMTGTFEAHKSYRDTIKTKIAFERFVGDLSKKYGCKDIEYFVAVERFAYGDFTHIHTIMNGVDGLRYKDIGEVWRMRYGRNKIEKYESTKGANYYLTKYVTKDLCDWGFRFSKTKSEKLWLNEYRA